MTTTDTAWHLLAAARTLVPRIRAAEDEAERARHLDPDIARALSDAGLFGQFVPQSLGGAELDPVTAFDVTEEVAKADAAAAWCLMISASITYAMVGWLAGNVAAAIFRATPGLRAAGSGLPKGIAVAVDGGYRLTGRWSQGSGIQHADWVMGAARVLDGEIPRCNSEGRPEIRHCFFPAREVEVIDTWTTTGLRGTGSHDWAVTDLFVPAELAVLRSVPPLHRSPLYGYTSIYRVQQAAHAIGIAQTGVDELIELAGGKIPSWSPRRDLLRDGAMVQARVGQATTLIGSARAYMRDVAGELWGTVSAGDTPSAAQRAAFCLAVTHAVQASVQAVDLMYGVGGASSVYTTSRLDRCFRNVHAAAQHVAVWPQNLEAGGRLLLGLDSGNHFYP